MDPFLDPLLDPLLGPLLYYSPGSCLDPLLVTLLESFPRSSPEYSLGSSPGKIFRILLLDPLLDLLLDSSPRFCPEIFLLYFFLGIFTWVLSWIPVLL
jgi:hypothetical protein